MKLLIIIAFLMLSVAIATAQDATTDGAQKGFQITIKTPSGQFVTVDVMPTDTIRDLKRKLHEKLGYDIDLQDIIKTEERVVTRAP